MRVHRRQFSKADAALRALRRWPCAGKAPVSGQGAGSAMGPLTPLLRVSPSSPPIRHSQTERAGDSARETEREEEEEEEKQKEKERDGGTDRERERERCTYVNSQDAVVLNSP